MKAHQLFTLIQSGKLGRNNRSMQSLHNDDIVTKSRKLAWVKSSESFPQIPLNWDLLAKQCDRLHQFFVRFAETPQEPKVTWRVDHQGQSHFEIYDPSTEKYHYFDSEQNALVWLDRHRFENASQSRDRQSSEGNEKLLNKNIKSFDYFGRR